MNRRFVIIAIVGIIILALLGTLLYIASKRQNGFDDQSATPAVQIISEDQAISPIASLDDTGVWYFTSDGSSFRVNTDGTGLTEFPLPPLQDSKITKILWSRSGSDFIAVVTSLAGTRKLYYNSVSKAYTVLPSNIQSLDWLPDNRRVAYIWQSADHSKQQLVIANSDSTGFTNIKDVFWPDLTVKVSPDGKTALLIRSQLEGAINKIYSVDLTTGQFSTVVEQGKNLDVMWVSANRFLFTQSAVTPYPKVYLFDQTTKLATDLGFNTNLDKITVDKTSQNIYVAVAKTDNSGDRFVKVDLATFKSSDYFTPDQGVTAKNLMLIGNTLFFINNGDGKLYRINQ
jgi:hypothetical protein